MNTADLLAARVLAMQPRSSAMMPLHPGASPPPQDDDPGWGYDEIEAVRRYISTINPEAARGR